ncbi:2Fe-2S ferredoxin-type domain-containing protein [Emericellopsis atlantica]|uniref:2Fe-2S ferredoxin-type domain-containing protein n=1 Tax=Emericellopsis atlantica TaxID=2614577 RepID=A0A9P7ZF13_9HYPO|nr:2Fe-2S ferredoxin-type domain-containing protein [Emericellopsis atlantica]KAG9250913.1 2Fe-2S ferredoxin-type domain-containing protein [Emericellopsis atlantica]
MSTSRTFATSLARLSSTASRTPRTQTQTRALCSLPQSWSSNRPRTSFSMRSLVPAPAPSSRAFTTTSPRRHGHLTPPKPGEELHVTFIDKDGDEYKFQVSEGDNLLDIAQANDLEMEGACGGSCACSTCHVIVQDEGMYDKIPEPEDDENDMLDLAFGLTETSRLGCQVKMTKELDGLVVKLPSMTRNLQASDFS